MSTHKLVGQQNQCAGCKRYFARNSSFDKHRIGEFGLNRRCMTDQEMRVTFILGADGFFRKKPKDGQISPFIALRGNHGDRQHLGEAL